jgi:hypothetical protein
MEKRGVVDRDNTRDTEKQLPAGQKQADTKTAADRLDDDFTKRASDAAADKLKR